MPFIKKHRADILLIIGILLLSGAAWLALGQSRGAGGEVVVTIDGIECARLPLSSDIQRLFESENGQNLLIIEDGQAYIKEASCPDHICINQGRICRDGEVIVCLPNRLVVTVEGGESGETDAETR